MAEVNPSPTARSTESERRFSNSVPPGLTHLPQLDPRSEEFLTSLRSFLSSKDGRASMLALSEEDARLFIEIIDKALRVARLEPELRRIALGVLRRLCGRVGHLPESYLLSDKFDLSGMPRASGGFADVWKAEFRGEVKIAIKCLRVSDVDDIARIRKHFCKEVAIWKNLSHPNVLSLIGVPDTFEDGRLSMVYEWMANGNIVQYVRHNPGNHLKLLADAAEGLTYIHDTNIIHGDLKGANILIANTDPPTARLADFGLTTIMDDPNLWKGLSESTVGGGTMPFMAPELLLPSRFGLDRCTLSKEADVYAMAMVIYQVLTGTSPFGKLSGPEVVLKVFGGERPSKPTDAPERGLSDRIWRLLEDCWRTEPALRPSIKDVLARVKAAAWACGTLSSVRSIPNQYEDPGSDFTKFGMSLPHSSCGAELIGLHGSTVPRIDTFWCLYYAVQVMKATVNMFLGPTPYSLIEFNLHLTTKIQHRSGSKKVLTLERERTQEYADTLDASLGEKTMCNQSRTEYLKCLRMICIASGILPSSFILPGVFDGYGASPLATGGYAHVSRASFEGRPVAVKTFFITRETDGPKRMHRLLAREVVGWKWLQHKNVLPFVGVTPELAIVSEFMENGNIMEFIANHPRHNRLHLLMGAACGLEYLHSQGIVHGDLKGANVLIDPDFAARLADFGLTMIIDESTSGSTPSGHELRGTTRWMAPELLYPEHFGFPRDCQKRLPSKSTDIYALGMTVLEVLTGKRPFNDIRRLATVILHVTMGKKPDRPPLGFSDELWNVLLTTWDAERGSQPPIRPPIQTIANQLEEDAKRWDQFIIPPTERGDESCTSFARLEMPGGPPVATALLVNPKEVANDPRMVQEAATNARSTPRTPGIIPAPETPTPAGQHGQQTPSPRHVTGRLRWLRGLIQKIRGTFRSLRARGFK